ncbi:phosphatase PAP2 family protein [Shewanella gelidimarina]|uniref:phosphatase PAP2 family protein n=1 Tax=Shewanella gelidimarina TaxID=56813 RepID=UPI00200F6ED3|nr:phosphatase PAP2 family protein [Shewanella gelidimarina]MCL1058484.1 phosphatase PAP2 family protein [Shewanella gelidimarina]
MNSLHRDAKTSSKLLLIGWATLLLIPASLYIFSVSMFPRIELDTHFAQLLYWITSTGTAPYGIATGIVILIACYRNLAKPLFLQLVLAVSISMAATLSLNHFLKPFFAEARPYAALLAQESLLNTDDFYQHNKTNKRAMISTAVEQLEVARTDINLSSAIKGHWQHEVGYSFPSGHTLFAVTLALVVSFYLLLAGQTLLPTALFSWAIAMGFSRMWLGMHWPQDVLASTVLGGIIALSSIAVMQTLSIRVNRVQKLSANE